MKIKELNNFSEDELLLKEKELKKSPEFRKAYNEEVVSLRDHTALISKPSPGLPRS